MRRTRLSRNTISLLITRPPAPILREYKMHFFIQCGFSQPYCKLTTHTIYHRDPQSLLINLRIMTIKHMTEMVEIVTRFSELVLGTEFPQESELRSETSAAVPQHIKVSLSQVKVRSAPTASAQQSQIMI